MLKGGKRKKRIVLCILAIAVIAVAVVFAAVNLADYISGVNEAERLKSLSEDAREEAAAKEVPDSTEAEMAAVPAESPEPEATEAVQPEKPRQIMAKYDKLLELNSEVRGWIKIDGTRIDYPFLQHSDNDYYLHTDINNKKSKRGSVEIDYRSNGDLSGKNTLVYGHNMKDGSMFKDLVKYKNKDFFDSHGIIHMDNLYEQIDWQVFSVYVVDADRETIDPEYPDDEAYLKELNRFRDRSMFKTDVELDSRDTILTLVTCSYETSNSRTIVHAKRISG